MGWIEKFNQLVCMLLGLALVSSHRILLKLWLMEAIVNGTGSGWYYRLLPSRRIRWMNISRRIRWMNAFGQIHRPLITMCLASYHSSTKTHISNVLKNQESEEHEDIIF